MVDELTPGMLRNFDTFRDFTGNEAEEVLETELDLPESLLKVGELTGIMYEATRDDITEEYLHEFESDDLPILAADVTTGQLFIVGGDYSFTEFGIVDN